MNTVFIAVLGLLLAAYLAAGFRWLRRERFQFVCALPVKRESDGAWRSMNFTWYGLLSANAYAFATAVWWGLMASIGAPAPVILALAALILLICVPASGLMAYLVEGRRYTLTVGGAMFVGAIAMPGAVWGVNHLFGASGGGVPLTPALAAAAIAYVMGEAVGRLSCVSFGCCYGKPVARCSEPWRRWFGRWHLAYHAPTHKAVYESGYRDVPLVPVAMITACVLSLIGLGSIALWLTGRWPAALVLALAGSQGWRFASEFLRDDDRGGGAWTAYQWMALLVLLAAAGWGFFAPDPGLAGADIAAGLGALWHPLPLLSIQAVWIATALYSGLSQVTGSTVRFHLHENRCHRAAAKPAAAPAPATGEAAPG